MSSRQQMRPLKALKWGFRMEDAREWLCEHGNDDSVVFDGPDYDSAIIGVSTDGNVIYDFDKMVEQLSTDDNITREEAIEFIEYNTIRAIPYAGEPAPIVIHMMEDE